MNRKQRTILLLVIFWSVVLGVPCVWLWRANWQERCYAEDAHITEIAHLLRAAGAKQ